MNIAYIHTGMWPKDSASTTFATMTAVSLAEEGAACRLFMRRFSEAPVDELFRRIFDMDRPDKADLFLVEPGRFFRWNRFFYNRVFNELEKMADAGALDAIVSRGCTSLPWLVKISKTHNVQAWYEPHNFFGNLAVRDDLAGKKRKRHSRIEKKYLPRVTGLICLLNEQKQLFEKQYPGIRTVVAHGGIREVAYSDGNVRRSIACIGSLDRHKGIDLLIRAAAKSRCRPPVIIIGGKSDKEIEAFRAFASSLGYGDKTSVTGWVKKAELRRLLAGIRVGVLPLTDTFFNRHLTTPLKLFDFFGSGVPVIASDLPSLRELVQENETGVFFPPGDVDRLAGRIDELFSDEKRCEKMVPKVVSAAEKLLWSVRARKILSAVQEGQPCNGRTEGLLI